MKNNTFSFVGVVGYSKFENYTMNGAGRYEVILVDKETLKAYPVIVDRYFLDDCKYETCKFTIKYGIRRILLKDYEKIN